MIISEKPLEDKNTSENILGELLTFLRKNKSMQLLLMCRQIKKIEVNNGIAKIWPNDDDIEEFKNNEKHKAELKEFFESKNLSFDIVDITSKDFDKETLNQILGGKLVVK